MRYSLPGLMRSKLFVPASRPELFQKALVSDADAICFDLEDAVLPGRKAEARSNLGTFLSGRFRTKKMILVRVNQVQSDDFADDLAAVVGPNVSAVVLPKVDDAAEVRDASSAMAELENARCPDERIAVLVTIESPRGLRFAPDIVEGEDRVAGLQLGLADLFEPLGIRRGDEPAAYQARFHLRLSGGEAGIPCFDSAFNDFKNEAGFAREAMEAHRLGYAGKSCIHPSQIAAANRIFSPSANEIVESQRILEAASEAAALGSSVFTLDGHMIDGPFVRRAESIVRLAQKIRAMEMDKS